MEIAVFLGAEGAAEVEGQPWVRDATRDEYDEYRQSVGDARWPELTEDKTKRPYFLVFVSDTAPKDVWEVVNVKIKMKRLRE